MLPCKILGVDCGRVSTGAKLWTRNSGDHLDLSHRHVLLSLVGDLFGYQTASGSFYEKSKSVVGKTILQDNETRLI